MPSLPLPTLAVALQNSTFITIDENQPVLRIDHFDITDGSLLCHDENDLSSTPGSIVLNLADLNPDKVQLLRLIPLEFDRNR